MAQGGSVLTMPSKIDAEGRYPGIGQPYRQSEHLFLAAAVAVNQDRTCLRSRGVDEIRRDPVSIFGKKIVELNQFNRHLSVPVPRIAGCMTL
jgi:hypothetical protein